MTAQMSISKDELQQIAAEVYKKNAELAVKNRAFSLLEKLYKASAAGLDINPLATELCEIIRTSLNLPFVAIATNEHHHDFLLRGVAMTKRLWNCTSVVLPQRYHVPSTHIIAETLSSTSKQTTKVVARAVAIFDEIFPKQLSDVEETLCLPLLSGRKKLGVLILCLPKEYREFSRFEQQTMRNLVQVVSIAIDRSTVYEDLKKANDRLKELDKLKTEFLSIATHQLRTPLSIIKGYTSLLDEGAYGKVTKAQREILSNIDVSNERLIKLVDEFLNVSRLEQGRTQYQFEELNLREVVDSVVVELSKKAEPKQIVLATELLDSAMMVGDASRIRHGVFNFVDNAIKYSPKESTVQVILEKKGNDFFVRVVDAGPGLDKNDLKNLFQKFYRSPNVSRDFEGNGLGLYVVKEFIEAHGGTVWATSDGIGKGSEFGFSIPKKPKRKRT